jgi:hypothetical protein
VRLCERGDGGALPLFAVLVGPDVRRSTCVDRR